MVQDLFKSEGKRPNVIEINTTGELCIREAPELVHAIQNSRKCKERRQLKLMQWKMGLGAALLVATDIAFFVALTNQILFLQSLLRM